ncbi:autotransporter-associated beta strand repeat-containing protein, partial [Klebsiella variicola]|uniref:autotransporter-associated beta strand repeat-containing protein n=1 Tax=Klebsiella variicola TaxID=244366 RepID=UPI00272F180D
GDVTNNSRFVIDHVGSVVLDGAISGSGSLSQIGSGLTVLGGDNNYTGGTSISAGTLMIGEGGQSGAITGSVTNNGTLAFNRSDAFTFAGA